MVGASRRVERREVYVDPALARQRVSMLVNGARQAEDRRRRYGDRASVVAKVGHFGLQHECAAVEPLPNGPVRQRLESTEEVRDGGGDRLAALSTRKVAELHPPVGGEGCRKAGSI